MLIRWVNHASFLIETGNIKLICDPWIEGTAFNNSWRLLSPSKLSFDDFGSITHIWFSHEHPDHFSPPNLKKIPEEYRRKITVLFHWTEDKRVIGFCKQLGFQTRELPDARWVQIENMELICGRNEAIDSWLGIRADGWKLMNTNDCAFHARREVARIEELFGPADVLLTQFSYANWVGNRGDAAAHRRAAEKKLDEIRRQVEVLRPDWVVPSASFVWFCHEENHYINEYMNRVSDVAAFCRQALNVVPVVLYPGDAWELGAPHLPDSAIERYAADYERVFNHPALDRSKPVPDADLLAAAGKFFAGMQAKNNRILLALLPMGIAYLTDKDQTAIIHSTGMQLAPGRPLEPDVEMGSDALFYCLRFGWGGDALRSSGRFQIPAGANPRHFFRIFRIACLNTGEEYLDSKMVARKVLDRAANWAFRHGARRIPGVNLRKRPFGLPEARSLHPGRLAAVFASVLWLLVDLLDPSGSSC